MAGLVKLNINSLTKKKLIFSRPLSLGQNKKTIFNYRRERKKKEKNLNELLFKSKSPKTFSIEKWKLNKKSK